MSREAPKGKRKSQGKSRYCEIAQPSPEPGGGIQTFGSTAQGPCATARRGLAVALLRGFWGGRKNKATDMPPPCSALG